MTHLKSISLACLAAALFALLAAGFTAGEPGACAIPGTEEPGAEMGMHPLVIF